MIMARTMVRKCRIVTADREGGCSSRGEQSSRVNQHRQISIRRLSDTEKSMGALRSALRKSVGPPAAFARPGSTACVLITLLLVTLSSVACKKQPASEDIDGTGGAAVANYKDISLHTYKNTFDVSSTFNIKSIALWFDSCVGTTNPTITARVLDASANNVGNQTVFAPEGLCHDHKATNVQCRQDSDCPNMNEVCDSEPGWITFPMNGISVAGGHTYSVSVDQTSYSCGWGVMGSDTYSKGDAYEDNSALTPPVDFAFKVHGE